MKVIDASVAVRWFVEGEQGRDIALKVLDEIKSDPASFAVPEFFFLEMMNVLSRLTPNSQILNQYILGLFDLGMVQVRLGSKLLTRASSLAFDFKISGYDALYVAVAEVVEGRWITADAKAHLKIKSLDRSVLL